MQQIITQKITLPHISSGSVLEYYEGCLYIVGDDSPFLYKLTLTGEILAKICISPAYTTYARIPKAEKPDWEAGTIVHENEVPIFHIWGSGSKDIRKKHLRWNLLTNEIEIEEVPEPYETFSTLPHVQEVNIECAFAYQESVYFINRGGNFQPSTLWDSQRLRAIEIPCPIYSGNTSGISGAYYEDKKDILFLSASVESTHDAYNDGIILGSFIGYIPNFCLQLQQQTCEEIYFGALIPDIKVESLTLYNHPNEHTFSFFLVSDSDDGQSNLLEMVIHL